MAAGIPGRTTSAHRTNRKNLKVAVAEHNLPCALCGEKIDTTLPRGHRDAFEYGHIKSVKAYPELADDPSNGQPEHLRCNRNKGAGEQRLGLGDPSEVW
ncbi:HNH endonuclease [Microbacterium oleivorans]|uniref:HNH endonuclease n=1 Tax=Microbacterium oleivorans TaxID=273677 RepID=A0A7D5EVS0_9MICO|nr:HNH endonuclease [Microbacterium oleivorans]QLD10904.1 HNH endonuclease [Microbacterium oleivorans]